MFFSGIPGWREAQWVGNPSLLMAKKRRRERVQNVLVLGGSQGAKALNAWVIDSFKAMQEPERPALWHQVGQRHIEACQQAYHDAKVDVRLDGFIEEMAEAYDWADLVIARSGAMTVSELARFECPAILVPLPSAVDDHQTKNAAWLVDLGLAWLWPQSTCTPDRLCEAIRDLQLSQFKPKYPMDSGDIENTMIAKMLSFLGEECIISSI